MSDTYLDRLYRLMADFEMQMGVMHRVLHEFSATNATLTALVGP